MVGYDAPDAILMADVDAWMPLWVGDYLADTQDLTTEEHGAYLLLLMTAWRKGGRLPAAPDRLARIVKMSAPEWGETWKALERFFHRDGDELVQNRLARELADAIAKKARASDHGRKAATQRHARAVLGQSSGSARAVPEDQPSPSPSPSPSETDPDPDLNPQKSIQENTTGGETAARSSPRPASRSSEIPVPAKSTPIAELPFPCDGKQRTWWVSQEQLAEWERIYPSLDVLSEMRKALAWVRANPSRRKTSGGMAAFLVNWLNRAQNRGGAREGPAPGSRRAVSDPNCKGWHAGGKHTGQRNPRGEQAGCPECKSAYIRSWTADERRGEPTRIGDLLPGGKPA